MFDLLILILLSSFPLVKAQQQDTNISNSNLSPTYIGITVTVVIVVIIVLYILNHFFFRPSLLGQPGPTTWANSPTHGNRLDPAVLDTFPIFMYSEITSLRSGNKDPDPDLVECPVCWSPFKGDEPLRLLPKCDHVFHRQCVDPWLVAHVTCPSCRASLVPEPDDSSQLAGPVVDEVQNDDVVEVRDGGGEEGMHLGKFWRSNSTGHHMENNGVRFTLLDEVRIDIVAHNKLARTSSCITRMELV